MSVQAQTGVPGSTLELYRAALASAGSYPALGDGELRWLDGPENVLVFERDPGFVWVDFGTEPVRLDVEGTLLLSSGRVNDAELDPDSAAWWGSHS